MTVYVESNFVIELALGQEQRTSAELLLQHAETHAISLAFPAIALSEPFTTITQRGRSRGRLIRQMNEQTRELARSQSHQGDATLLRSVAAVLTGIEERQVGGLMATVDRLLACGRVITFDAPIFSQAGRYRDRFGLTVQDAIILATVIADLEQQHSQTDSQHYFASKNWKDFGDPGIRAELATRQCRFVEDFEQLVALIDA